MPNTITDDFQQLVIEAIVRYDLKRTIAHECQVGSRTIEGWALKGNEPLPQVKTVIQTTIRELVDEAREARIEVNNAAIASARSMNDWD